MFENFLGGRKVERFAIHQNKTYHVGVTVPIFGHAGGLSLCLARADENYFSDLCFLVGFCEILCLGIPPTILKGNTMTQAPVVSAVIKALSIEQTEQAHNAGSMFAKSEIDADEALESFARALTTEPTYAVYEESRIEWVSGYLDIKPQAKGNSADKAFKRFMGRLVDKYGFDIPKPKSDNPAATKKRMEREAKKAKVLDAFSGVDTSELKTRLSQAFATLASKPDSKVAESAVKNLKAVLRERTKDDSAALKAEVSEKRQTIRGLLSGCSDIERLDAVIEILSPDNDVTIQ